MTLIKKGLGKSRESKGLSQRARTQGLTGAGTMCVCTMCVCTMCAQPPKEHACQFALPTARPMGTVHRMTNTWHHTQADSPYSPSPYSPSPYSVRPKHTQHQHIYIGQGPGKAVHIVSTRNTAYQTYQQEKYVVASCHHTAHAPVPLHDVPVACSLGALLRHVHGPRGH